MKKRNEVSFGANLYEFFSSFCLLPNIVEKLQVLVSKVGGQNLSKVANYLIFDG